MGERDDGQTALMQCGDCGKEDACKAIGVSFCFPEPLFPPLYNGNDKKTWREVEL